MSIELFQHNQNAYVSAVRMLREKGKAAIIHPTGTGKSFIGFKVCEENADKIICWLSPSEYIFKTQIDNLKKAADGYEPQNVKFFTYAKLMMMSESELADICPDYIILDEFHRCGAEMWGRGVQSLLKIFPSAPIIGLSATNIRYLDNQRNMADELFDGNIASEMTLGEAIVRGILNPPKYVLSMFCYQNSLEKYELRTKKLRNKFVRNKADLYLEELRRTLEKADGLDVIFDKHMTDRTGKYIVFCSNKEHMDNMMSHTEWFAKIDKNPHMYSVYSPDPSASHAFDDFCKDSDDTHLRLLFCIDALNEGIHLENISGVILLRPTVSPIIYKQQIGRALSASKKKDAVIFDVVLNIENLYSIGAIQEEMEIATIYYTSLGEKKEIVNERFNVIDEVRDCRVLFDKLNDTLTTSWDTYYKQAKIFYEENGNLQIPARYVTADGYTLGRWIFNQKGIRKGTIAGKLTSEQIHKLDRIGMVWEYYTDLNWERNYAAGKAYFEAYGDLAPNAKYVTEDGVALGSWLSNIRTWNNAGAHCQYLTPERIASLNRIGMVWDVLDYFWEKNYMAAVEYYKEHGNLDVPCKYVSPNGIKLGSWLSRMRQLRYGKAKRGFPPTKEQIARLDNIGMIWESRNVTMWEKGYEAAKEYVRENGNLLIPNNYVTKSGFKLRNWIDRQRAVFRKGTFDPERKQRLDNLGMIWEPDTWESRFDKVKKYYEKNGTININQKIVVDGVWIGKWIITQKKRLEAGELSDEQAKLLCTLPIEEIGKRKDDWFSFYQDAIAYKEKCGSFTDIPKSYKGANGHYLAGWVFTQRRKYHNGQLTPQRIEYLESIGFNWTTENAWDRGYRYAKDYYAEHGNLLIKQSYKTSDGYGLGAWVSKYRSLYAKSQLTDDAISALDEIGMVWELEAKKYSTAKVKAKVKPTNNSATEKKVHQPPNPWDVNYRLLKKYYEKNGNVSHINPKTPEEKKIYNWLNNQRKRYRDGHLVKTQLSLLEEVGITEEWLKPLTPFEKGYLIAKEYYLQNGSMEMPTNYQHTNGFWLGAWVEKVRNKKNRLSEKQIEMLDAIEFIWEPLNNWEEKFAIAKSYFDANGFLPLEPKQCITKEDQLLCQWLRRQLLRRNAGKMPQDQIVKLTDIGMDWLNAVERTWARGLSHAQAYQAAHGDLNVPVSFVCEDGYPLGEWLHSQRTHRKRLSQDKKKVLVELGANGLTG